ncbi:DUF6973 domain-containing protein [Pyxidicoccus trucidator]|uniref:DUF6973 domain-containing protein n=1 Tax=Pyxidicoccus trucidator TaxID=2709662 RepID=UPI0013DD2480|nr:hypothetical protein [Pyxidicoccus trucidator]
MSRAQRENARSPERLVPWQTVPGKLRKRLLATVWTLLPLAGLAVLAPAGASAGPPAEEEQEAEQVEAAPEIAAEAQALDVSDEALTEDADRFIKDHPRPKGKAASDSEALARRIESVDPDQFLQALEELRKEGLTAESTPDFAQRLEKKLEGLPAAPKKAASDDVETLALGPQEKKLCIAFPDFCASSFALGQVAEQKAKRYGKLHNGKGDAFKHAYWSALMTFYHSELWAKALGNAHEARPKNPKIERRMDLHNNAVGRGHGKRANIVTSVDDGVDRSFKRGDLLRISCGGKGRSHLVATDRGGDYCD